MTQEESKLGLSFFLCFWKNWSEKKISPFSLQTPFLPFASYLIFLQAEQSIFIDNEPIPSIFLVCSSETIFMYRHMCFRAMVLKTWNPFVFVTQKPLCWQLWSLLLLVKLWQQTFRDLPFLPSCAWAAWGLQPEEWLMQSWWWCRFSWGMSCRAATGVVWRSTVTVRPC